MDCVVRSVSDTGAGLELDGVNVVIPNAFVLEFDGVAHDCVIAWRSERRIGVAGTRIGIPEQVQARHTQHVARRPRLAPASTTSHLRFQKAGGGHDQGRRWQSLVSRLLEETVDDQRAAFTAHVLGEAPERREREIGGRRVAEVVDAVLVHRVEHVERSAWDDLRAQRRQLFDRRCGWVEVVSHLFSP